MQMETPRTTMTSRGRNFFGTCLLIILSAGKALGESIVIQPSADTSIFAGAPNNNLGSNANFFVGGNGVGFPGRGLIRFDPAPSIPSNAVIQSVTLVFNVVVVSQESPGPATYQLRRVLAGWEEGDGTGNTGSAALSGEVTWNNRVHPSTPWGQPGGTITNDFSETISASTTLGNVGNYTIQSTPGLVADVQNWLQHPGTNFGWVMICESETTQFTSRRIASRENAGNGPQLIVAYALASRTRIEWIAATNGNVHFGFLAQSNRAYIAQYRDSPTSGLWQTLTNFGPLPAITSLVVVDWSATNAQRFYRIGELGE